MTQGRINGTIGSPEVPSLTAGHVPRPRLQRALHAAVQHPLTLVLGPPGAGKTVLLAEWATMWSSTPVAWVTLDTMNRDAGSFWTALAGAVGRVAPDMEAGGDDWASAASGHDSLAGLLTALPPLIIVLDGFERALTDATLDATTRLVECLPRHLRLVIASRQSPQMVFRQPHRLGRGPQVGGRDLAFTNEEATRLIEVTSRRRLPRGEVRGLVERMEGWVTGLRLAADALAASDPSGAAGTDIVRHFDGGSEAVAAYARSEVLDDEDERTRRFLMETSVLPSFGASLCQAMTGRADSGAMLERLVDGGLIEAADELVPGGDDPLYRYHRAFGAGLRRILLDTTPGVEARLLERAASWYRQHAEPRRAAAALARAGDFDGALEIIGTQCARGLEAGIPSVGDQIDLVLDGDESADPWRIYAFGLGHLCALVPESARLWLLRLEGLDDARDGPELAVRTEMLWATYYWERQEPEGALHHGLRARAMLDSLPANSDRPVRAWLDRAELEMGDHVLTVVARAQAATGDGDAARATLAAMVSGGPPALAVQDGILAAVAAGEGRLSEASAAADRCLAAIDGMDGWVPTPVITAHQVVAATHRERDELDRAWDHLDQALDLAERLPYGDRWLADVELDRYEVSRALGRPGALGHINRVRRLDEVERLPDHLRRRLVVAEVRSRLDAGDIRAAAAFLDATPPVHRSPALVARLHLRGGRPDRALRALERAPVASPSSRLEIERLLLTARAQLQLGDRRALGSARRAVDAARPEGYLRPFVDEGQEVELLLQLLRSAEPHPFLERLLDRFGPKGPVRPLRGDAATIIEPLTDREREVLSYLPTHLTQHQIAGEIYVSVNTLKTHVKGLYRKLGAASRADAVHIARIHGVI